MSGTRDDSGRRDDRETLLSESSLGVDDTIQADSQPSGSAPPSSNTSVIRQGRASAPRTKLGRYTIVGVLGRGGMGQVYEAEDPELGRRVAIKVLREGRGNTSTLLREAQALAKLVHPNVITIHDVGSEEDGSVFLVMHLVDGEPIDRWLERRRANPREVIAAFRQAGLGLAAAHAAGLVHCDFKPSNVLVDSKGDVRVGDFGLARGAGEAGEVAGTPAYMAPEQFGGDATSASDQFSFCVALWEILAGEPPFERSSLEDGPTLAATRERRPMPRGKGVPARVVRALERGLSAEPRARFPSMQALLDALAPPRRAGVAIGAGAALAVGASVVAFTVGHDKPSPPPPVAAPVAKETAPPKLDIAHERRLTELGREGCAYAPTIVEGGTVVFDRTQRDAVDLYAMPIGGGAPKQLTTQPASWEWRSTRGQRPGEVVFLVHDGRTQEGASVSAIDLATLKQTALFESYAFDVATAGAAMFYIPLTAQQIRRWKHENDEAVISGTTMRFRQLAASPDGSHLAVVASTDVGTQVCIVDVAQAKIECLDGTVKNARPAFGADGRNVYYVTSDGIRRHDLASKTDEVAYPGARAIGGLAVAPDGSALVFSECGSQSRIVDATAPSKILIDEPTAHEPAVASNGSIAWTRLVKGVRVLVVRTADGKELQLTSPELGAVSTPAFSPDGNAVTFVVGTPHPGVHTARVAPDTYLERVTDLASDALPAWLDSEHVAFVRFDSSNVPSMYVVPAQGGDATRFGKVSRAVQGRGKTALLASSTGRMFWVDAKTGVERAGPPHPESTSDIAVSPSGNWVGYTAGQAGQELWRISIEPPGKLEHVLSLPTGQTSSNIAITDDGHILFAPETWSGDLFAVPAAAGTAL